MPSALSFLSALGVRYFVCADAVFDAHLHEHCEEEQDHSFLCGHRATVRQVVRFEQDEEEGEDGQKDVIILFDHQHRLQRQ